MTLRDLFNTVLSRMPLSVQFLAETLHHWRSLCRFNADVDTERDIKKMQYTLLRQNHIIEKGLSMRNTRKGFGQAKVTTLITRLRRYHQLYATTDYDFILYPLSTIKAYIAYQRSEGIEIPQIEAAFKQLCDEAGVTPDDLQIPAGIEHMKATELQKEAKGDYASLLYSRHSIRYFLPIAPSTELIEQALVLASRTPSACNRQAWHTHIYRGDDAHELLRMQGGCNGFCDDIPCCIVVTADMKGFLSHEPFQCYIDGGLYAQNLINALHYVGLGSIPLSCGFKHHHLQHIHEAFHIPANEVLIVIIGTGVMVGNMKIAASTRRSITTTNTYH